MSKVVIVTGATRGIGRAIALQASERGWQTVLVARSAQMLCHVACECRTAGAPEPMMVPCDVRNPDEARRIPEALSDINKKFELALVNNAGYARFDNLQEADFALIDEQIRTNLVSLFAVTQACLPMLLERKGDIVNILSVAATHAFPGASAYCASKAGGLMFSRCLASEVRKQGVRVMAVLPGSVDTELWDGQSFQPPRERMLRPDDVANAVCDALQTPRTLTMDEIVLMPPEGIL